MVAGRRRQRKNSRHLAISTATSVASCSILKMVGYLRSTTSTPSNIEVGRRVSFNADPPPTAPLHRNVSNQSTIDSGLSESSICRMFGLTSSSTNERQRRLRLLMDQCEMVRFPFKKKLILANLNLNHEEIPVDEICSDTLGMTLYKLSLAGNRLHSIPEPLTVKLTGLRLLDIRQCDLQMIPVTWDMPLLKKLIMSHNQIKAFPAEVRRFCIQLCI